MPRKSAAATELCMRFVPNERPKPPEILSADEAKQWVRIVGSMPPEWFTQEVWPLLIQLCRIAVSADQIAAAMARCHDPSLPKYDQLFRKQLQVTEEITKISVKLRLTPQSRNNATSARRATKQAVAAQHKKQPWAINEQQ